MSTIFEELFDRSPIATLLVRANGDIRLVNRSLERLFQYERSELIGAKIETLVPEDVRSRHPTLVQEYVSAPLPRQMGRGRVLFGAKKDGSLFPVEVGLHPIEVDGETMVIGSVIDVTERQKAEQRLRAAFEAAPNGMLMIDASRRIVICNRQIESTFGYSRDELTGSTIETLVPDDFRPHHPRFVEAFFRKPESRSMGIGRELFGRHKSGRLIPVEIGLQPIVSGGDAFVIASVVDITFRRNAEAEIQRKTQEIEEFSYRTSHDLRSPLKSIVGIADCILDDIDANQAADARKGAQRIRQLSDKLLALVEDILTLTKVDLTNEPVGAFDFASYATTAADKFHATLAETRAELSFLFQHKRDLIVQPSRLTQVLDNLISNGVKYCDPNKSKRTVVVRTFNTASRFFIQVEDNGTGIPADRQTEVFGMFKRFHSGSIPGSGLGLYVVNKQVARLGAGITFESGPTGTTFHVEIPLESRERAPVPEKRRDATKVDRKGVDA